MKTCASPLCGKQFESSHGKQMYCTPKCRGRNHRLRHPEKRAEATAELIQWMADHPERVKQNQQRARQRNYRSGKLPSWMFS